MKERTSDDFRNALADQVQLVDPSILKEWLEHPITGAFKNFCRAMRIGIMESWADGIYQHETSELTAAATSKALGVVTGIFHCEDFISQLNESTKINDEHSSEGLPTSY